MTFGLSDAFIITIFNMLYQGRVLCSVSKNGDIKNTNDLAIKSMFFNCSKFVTNVDNYSRFRLIYIKLKHRKILILN